MWRCRVLRPGGAFIMITYGPPDRRLGPLTSITLPWDVAMYALRQADDRDEVVRRAADSPAGALSLGPFAQHQVSSQPRICMLFPTLFPIYRVLGIFASRHPGGFHTRPQLTGEQTLTCVHADRSGWGNEGNDRSARRRLALCVRLHETAASQVVGRESVKSVDNGTVTHYRMGCAPARSRPVCARHRTTGVSGAAQSPCQDPRYPTAP